VVTLGVFERADEGVQMITSLKRLSETLRKAASPSASELVSAIRIDRARIEKEISQSGASSVTVDGQRFKIVQATNGGGAVHSR